MSHVADAFVRGREDDRAARSFYDRSSVWSALSTTGSVRYPATEAGAIHVFGTPSSVMVFPQDVRMAGTCYLTYMATVGYLDGSSLVVPCAPGSIMSVSMTATTASAVDAAVSVPSPVVQDLQTLQAAFTLTQVDLTRVLGVSRQAIHAWRTKGVTPSPDHIRRLSSLARLAEVWQQRAVGSVGAGLHQRLQVDGLTLFELLCAPSLAVEAIQEHLATLAVRRQGMGTPQKSVGPRTIEDDQALRDLIDDIGMMD